MLSIPEMVRHSAPDAPPPTPLRCTGCTSLATRHHPAGMAAPHGTSARCIAAEGGTRLIGWEWRPTDATPTWCPKRSGAAASALVPAAASRPIGMRMELECLGVQDGQVYIGAALDGGSGQLFVLPLPGPLRRFQLMALATIDTSAAAPGVDSSTRSMMPAVASSSSAPRASSVSTSSVNSIRKIAKGWSVGWVMWGFWARKPTDAQASRRGAA